MLVPPPLALFGAIYIAGRVVAAAGSGALLERPLPRLSGHVVIGVATLATLSIAVVAAARIAAG